LPGKGDEGRRGQGDIKLLLKKLSTSFERNTLNLIEFYGRRLEAGTVLDRSTCRGVTLMMATRASLVFNLMLDDDLCELDVDIP
jgi:hypothetical protein